MPHAAPRHLVVALSLVPMEDLRHSPRLMELAECGNSHRLAAEAQAARMMVPRLGTKRKVSAWPTPNARRDRPAIAPQEHGPLTRVLVPAPRAVTPTAPPDPVRCPSPAVADVGLRPGDLKRGILARCDKCGMPVLLDQTAQDRVEVCTCTGSASGSITAATRDSVVAGVKRAAGPGGGEDGAHRAAPRGRTSAGSGAPSGCALPGEAAVGRTSTRMQSPARGRSRSRGSPPPPQGEPAAPGPEGRNNSPGAGRPSTYPQGPASSRKRSLSGARSFKGSASLPRGRRRANSELARPRTTRS